MDAADAEGQAWGDEEAGVEKAGAGGDAGREVAVVAAGEEGITRVAEDTGDADVGGTTRGDMRNDCSPPDG